MNRWLDRLALRSIFDPELRLPRETVERVLRVIADQEREYRSHLRRLRIAVLVLAIALFVIVAICQVRG